MNNLEQIFHIWKVLYAKDQDPKSVIEEFFHKDYTQSINGVVLNRAEYINHVIDQRKNIQTDLSTVFRTKNHAIFCKFSYSTGDK